MTTSRRSSTSTSSRSRWIGSSGFKTLLLRLADTWKDRRSQVETQADQLGRTIRQYAAAEPAAEDTKIDRHIADRLGDQLRRSADREHGGFGGAPKFPPHSSLRFFLYEARTRDDARALQLATATLDGMARGGIRDHVGGGFHRYATDAEWLVPQFEKMLYDNARLARCYVDAWRLTGDDSYRQLAEGIIEWVLRDLTDAAGGFHSAYDADSEGSASVAAVA